MNPMLMIGAAALLLLGAGLGYWLGSRRESDKASEIQVELDTYRKQVTEHFGETAAHFQAIGGEYKKLYQHMAAGAGQLCDGGDVVGFEPVEKLAEGVVIDEQSPPRDYEITGAEEGEQELPDIVSSEPGESEPKVMEEPTDEQLAETEAAEAQLAETETAEELLVDRELAVDEVNAEKTIH